MKVALLGTGSGWQHIFDEELFEWEVWGLNTGYLLDPEISRMCTRWFELHGDTPLTRARRPADHWQRLDALDRPVYTLYTLPVRQAVAFPIEECAAIRDYFACTFAYQIALALLEGATHITLYGVPLIGAREALVERPCVEWWLGYAEGRGVTCRVIHDCDYGLGRQAYRYAYNDQQERHVAYRYAYTHMNDMSWWLHDEDIRLRAAHTWRDRVIRWLQHGVRRLGHTPTLRGSGV